MKIDYNKQEVIHLQKVINLLSEKQISVDGIKGKKETIPAEKELVDRLKEYFKKKKWRWNQLNAIGLRTDDIYTNQFTDYLLLVTNNEIIPFPFSTKPGIQAVYKNAKATILGKQGVLCLKEDENYEDIYKFQGAWWSGKPFLWQCKGGMKGYRDNDYDNVIDKHTIHIDTDNAQFKANMHSWAGWFSHLVSYVNNIGQKISLSEGCMVMQVQFWDKAYMIMLEGNPNGFMDWTLLHVNNLKK